MSISTGPTEEWWEKPLVGLELDRTLEDAEAIMHKVRRGDPVMIMEASILLRELADARELIAPKTCGEPFPLMTVAQDDITCTLPAGHDGQHRAAVEVAFGDQERWSMAAIPPPTDLTFPLKDTEILAIPRSATVSKREALQIIRKLTRDVETAIGERNEAAL